MCANPMLIFTHANVIYPTYQDTNYFSYIVCIMYIEYLHLSPYSKLCKINYKNGNYIGKLVRITNL